jgi:hypothetical protein
MKKKILAEKFLLAAFCVLLVGTALFSLRVASTSAANDWESSGNQANSGSSGSMDPVCGGFKKEGPLCLPENPFGNSNNSLVGQTTATGLIATAIRLLLYFAGIIAVLFLIIGGYYYLTARGNEEQATKGRQTLIYALLGLSIVILSYVIVTAITNQLTANI